MKIAVVGVAQTKFGELWGKSLQDLLAEAMLGALHDAQLVPHDVGQIFIGNMCGDLLSGQLHLGAIAAGILGIQVPSSRIEGVCASGALALRAGIMALQSGAVEVVLVAGVEKLSDVSSNQIATAFMGASEHDVEHFVGATFPGLMALIARVYMQEYSVTREHLAVVSFKNHKNASLNPDAHFSKEVSLTDILMAPMVADPLSLMDCSPISDGAACVILTTPEFARARGLNSVSIIASAEAVDTVNLADRESLLEFKASRIAAEKAYAMAGLRPSDIDFVELHDAFTIAEIMLLEDLGFYQKGKAAHAARAGETALHGAFPVNTSGGLKAKGHPVGATGVAQVVEVVRQLRGQAGKRQVAQARVGMTHNMGGAGTTSLVHIFAKE